MKSSHRDLVFGETKRSDFLWCLHCERTYARGEYRQVGELQMCPHADCDGDAVGDAWDWETLRDYHPEYPAQPEPDVKRGRS